MSSTHSRCCAGGSQLLMFLSHRNFSFYKTIKTCLKNNMYFQKYCKNNVNLDHSSSSKTFNDFPLPTDANFSVWHPRPPQPAATFSKKGCSCSFFTGTPSLLLGSVPSYTSLIIILLQMNQVLTVISTLVLFPPLGTLPCLLPV